MDKQLLAALDNLSNALELISDVLSKKSDTNTTTANALGSGDFSAQLTEINTSIKSIKKDTELIIKNQETILNLSKQKTAEKNEIEKAGTAKGESTIKKGAQTILLIATAVLAIGLAFKIIGDINIGSVIALSLAMVIVSVAFEKIAKLDLPLESAMNVAATMVILAGAVTVSSWILRFVSPITLGQAVTSILIAGMFSVIAFGTKKLIGAFDNNLGSLTKSIIFLPLVMPAIALAITLSSYVLGLVKPISFGQAITSILIAGMFSVIAFGIKNLIGAFKGMDQKTILAATIMLPLLLPALSLAIAASSHALSLVKPIGFGQFITALGISILFVALAFSVKLMGESLKDIDLAMVFKLPLLFTTLSLAIAASSVILNETVDIDFSKLLKVLALGVVLAIVTTTMIPAMVAITKAKIGITDIIKGSLMIVLIAGAIMVSSHILAAGNYGKYPTLDWSMGVGLSLVAFSAAAVALGIVAMTGVGALAIAAGAGMTLVVAATIVGTSHILALGKYDKFPTLDWSKGVGLSMTTFGLAMVTIGSFVVGTLGLGGVAIDAGSSAVKSIANTIVETSFILKKGSYTGGPTKEWSEGISKALGAFLPVYGMLMLGGVMKFFGVGGVSVKGFTDAIRTVSQGIVDAAMFFKGKGGIFTGGPSKTWAEGVGRAIGAFAPVYSVLLKEKGILGTGVSVDDMATAIKTISQSIVDAASVFNNNIAVFDISKVPTAEWGKNVGTALGAFAPLFKSLSQDTGIFTSGSDVVANIQKGINGIAISIVNTAIKFYNASVKSGGKIWNAYPTKAWNTGVASVVATFVSLIKKVKGLSFGTIDLTARRIVSTAQILYNGRKFFSNVIDPSYIKNLSSNIVDYAELAKKLTSATGKTDTFKSLLGMDAISQTARGMVKIADAYDKLGNALKKFGGALESIDGTKVDMIRKLTGNMAVLSAMNAESFASMMTTLETNASVFSKLVDNGDKSRPTVGDKKEKIGDTKIGKVKPKSEYGDLSEQLDMVINLLTNIGGNTNALAGNSEGMISPIVNLSSK